MLLYPLFFLMLPYFHLFLEIYCRFRFRREIQRDHMLTHDTSPIGERTGARGFSRMHLIDMHNIAVSIVTTNYAIIRTIARLTP